MERKDRIFNLIEHGTARQLKAGLCHDVQKKEQFLLFSGPNLASSYFGEAEVDVSYNLASDLTVPPDLPPRAFAVKAIQRPVARVFSFPFQIQESLKRFSWLPRLGVDITSKPVHVRAADEDLASFELIHQTGSWVKLKYLTAGHRLAETLLRPWPIKVIEWANILQHIGHFFHHLNRLERNWDPDPAVEIAIAKVRNGRVIDDRPLRLGPDGVEILADDSTEYGFEVTNRSDHPIFFSLFYFDMSKFSISEWTFPDLFCLP